VFLEVLLESLDLFVELHDEASFVAMLNGVTRVVAIYFGLGAMLWRHPFDMSLLSKHSVSPVKY
jgi:hypothetical protein